MPGLAVGLFASLPADTVACSIPGCDTPCTLSPRARLSGVDPSQALCPEHHARALGLADRQAPCSVRTCRRARTFTAQEQLALLAPDGFDPGVTAQPVEPPAGICAPCTARRARLRPRESVCQVHGCTQEVTLSVSAQLAAWAALGTDDPAVEPRPPRRMCRACRDFCRTHPDREVPCVRAGCSGTWTFKSGAQLHARLDGKRQDPARPCARCLAMEAEEGSVADAGTQTMPCVTPGCAGTWAWAPGTRLRPATEGDRPTDRMCPACRARAERPPPAATRPRGA